VGIQHYFNQLKRTWFEIKLCIYSTLIFVPHLFNCDFFSHTFPFLKLSSGISFNMHSYIHTHTYIHFVGACVTKTVGYGKSHKYTNIHNFYSVKYYKRFTKQDYGSLKMVYLKAMLSTLSVTE
jgi:hypothetical protein